MLSSARTQVGDLFIHLLDVASSQPCVGRSEMVCVTGIVPVFVTTIPMFLEVRGSGELLETAPIVTPFSP